MDRTRGYWWSPDSRRIAFAEVDERHIPVYRIMHQGADAVGDAAQEDHRYGEEKNGKGRKGAREVSFGVSDLSWPSAVD